MPINKAGAGLDWLQRLQALGAALLALKLWLVPLVGGGVGAYLAGLEHVPLSRVYLFALYGFAGGLFVVGGVRTAFARRAGPVTDADPVRRAPRETPKGGPPPVINVEPHDGEEAILMVTNLGGDGVFQAEGRILAVSRETFRHRGPFQMKWRGLTDHKLSKNHRVLIKANERMKLVVGSYSGGEWGSTFRIHGDEWVVETLTNNHSGESPKVTLRVTISTEPQSPPVTRELIAWCPPRRFGVEIKPAPVAQP